MPIDWQSLPTRSADNASEATPPRRTQTGWEWIVTGPLFLFTILFVLFGLLQIGGAIYFFMRGHPAFVWPEQRSQEALSIELGGWLPLGLVGVVMLGFGWLTHRIRRGLSGDEHATRPRHVESRIGKLH